MLYTDVQSSARVTFASKQRKNGAINSRREAAESLSVTGFIFKRLSRMTIASKQRKNGTINLKRKACLSPDTYFNCFRQVSH